MGFKRAEWHSGLVYRQICEECKTGVEYMDDKLDFRPWYPDGFVYCPRCKTPLRHSEKYAVDPATGASLSLPTEVPAETIAAQPAGVVLFCTQCGNKFGENDRFCAKCGNKR
ncbi:MAG: zinc ribbon domain-containing protein [Ruminococcaceae bacterium]|nr:zinc ribbon domain-containing protein [Oscillospiraceae bacterium]